MLVQSIGPTAAAARRVVTPYSCEGRRLVAVIAGWADGRQVVYGEIICANDPRTLHGGGQDTAAVPQ